MSTEKTTIPDSQVGNVNLEFEPEYILDEYGNPEYRNPEYQPTQKPRDETDDVQKRPQ